MADIDKQNEATNWRNALMRWTLDPWVALQPAMRRRSQALTLLVLILLVSGSVITGVYIITVPDDPGNLMSIIGLMLLIPIYIASRQGYVQAVALTIFVVTSVPIFLMASPMINASEYILMYLLIPITIAIFFLPTWLATVLTSMSLAGMLVAALAFENMSFSETLIGPFSISVPVAFVMLVLRGFNRGTTFSETDGRVRSHYQKLMDFHPDMMAIHRDGKFVYINQMGVKLLGYAHAEELIGQPHKDYLARVDGRFATAEIIQDDEGETFAMRSRECLRDRHGVEREVEVTAIPILFDGALATQVLVRDVTKAQQNEQSLHELEISYRNIIELISDYTYEGRFDDDGSFRLVWLSDGFKDVMGYEVADVLANTPDPSLIYPEDFTISQAHHGVLKSGQIHVTEFRAITASGKIRWLRDHAQPTWDEAHEHVIGYTGTVQDITERTEAEMALKSHALQQAVVAELGQRALDHPSDWTTLVDEAITLTAQVLNVEYCKLLELDSTRERLIVRSATGWDVDIVGRTLPTEKYSSQAAFALTKPVPVVREYTSDNIEFAIHNDVDPPGVKCGISVVIRGQSQVMGVLEGHSEYPRNFSLDDVNFIQSIANVLTAFLGQRRMQVAEQEQRDMVQSLNDIATTINSTLEFEEVLDRVLDSLSRVLPYDAASFMLMNEKSARIIRHAGHEAFGGEPKAIYEFEIKIENNPLLMTMQETGQPLYVPDVRNYPGWNVVPTTEWIRSYLGAPIVFQGETLGFINVDSLQLDAFTDVHSRQLMAFADQVSVAIRNARRAGELEAEVHSRTRELDRERHRLQSILESTGEGIIYAEDGIIKYTNEMLHRMTGHAPDALVDCPLLQLVEVMEDDDYELEMDRAAITQTKISEAWEAVAEGRVWRGEMWFQRAEGKPFEAGLTISRANEINGVLHAVIVVRNISQIKAVEAAQERFIKDAAHDLRSPIASLLTTVYLLKRELPQNNRLHKLDTTAKEIQQLVEELLDVSNPPELHPVDTVLQDLIEMEVSIQQDTARESHQIDLLKDFVPDPVRALVDHTHMKRVIRNLISNSMKFTPKDGSGRIDVCIFIQQFDETATPERHYLNQRPVLNGMMAVIMVKDNGIGMSPADLERIFDPMVRLDRKIKGNGLGLSISREIVRKHNGDIRVESEPGKGSTFYVVLPLLPPMA